MYTSTRKKLKNISSSQAILKGISDDGGLFIKDVNSNFIFDASDVNLTYQELSIKILSYFLDDFSQEAINKIVYKTYSQDNFSDKIIDVKQFTDFAVLELFHGPTLAFKDMALTMLPLLIDEAKRINKDPKKSLILTATSGDTGSAALSGFSNTPNCRVLVLYPNKGISEIQEKQMLYYAKNNNYALAIDGNFDQCQKIVKELFQANIKLEHYELSSANSINIGRLIPQVIYYFACYFELVKSQKISFGTKINVIVPTGNFGNILALYMAKQMGLFIDKLIVASNRNNVLTEFFETGLYNANRPFHNTLSPSMDILVSSNLERLLYLITKDESYVNKLMMDLKEKGKYQLDEKYLPYLKDFLAISCNDNETIEAIKKCYQKNNYLLDPHTAVAYYAKETYPLDNLVIVATASPYKFMPTIDAAIPEIKEKLEQSLPLGITKLHSYANKKRVIDNNNALLEIRKIIGEIDALC